MDKKNLPDGLSDFLQFPLIDALLGRRSRRFFKGAQIPDGAFAFTSKYNPLPLSDLEKNIIISACAGNTGWHNLIPYAPLYSPFTPNYPASAAGRSFPSSAGFHTSMTFFTDDEGVYVLNNRDGCTLSDHSKAGPLDFTEILDNIRSEIIKIQPHRLSVPYTTPFTEAHNTWVVNHTGTFLVIPVGDLAQHMLLNLCYMLQNGLVIYDDLNKQPIPGISEFNSLVKVDNSWPLTFVEQWSLAELTVELATSCYAGVLTLQAMGLGGWMFNGLDSFSVLGASGDPLVQGLGFRYDTNNKWPHPNVTGLTGIMEGFCPPHYRNMSDAVDAVCDRKFGPGGPFHSMTPGPWKNTSEIRSSAQVHDKQFRRCIALQAQYIFDSFGKFPATVPSIFCIMYLQAHHLDLDFYDNFYKDGAYLNSHAEHMSRWH